MKCKTADRPDVAAVVVCAGKGERSGLAYNKVLYRIGHKTLLERVLDVISRTEISHTTVVASAADMDNVCELVADYDNVSVVLGGETRAQSVLNGLNARKCDIVVIHDGARPFADPEIFTRSINSAITYGSGIAAVPAVDTIKRINSDGTLVGLKRDELFNIQTPQTFRYDEITDAYARAGGDLSTDDAEVYERAGYFPRPVVGDYKNKKITTPSDLVAGLPESCRVGVGFDVHRLVEGRRLVLGGVEIPHSLGLLGHSDADVLTHAIMDALLSAAGLPDIGVLFPDTDAAFAGISSMILLKSVAERISDAGYNIINISTAVMAQKPKLAPVISQIRNSLAAALEIDAAKVNISATTTEELGIVGQNQGMAATASCLLAEKDK